MRTASKKDEEAGEEERTQERGDGPNESGEEER